MKSADACSFRCCSLSRDRRVPFASRVLETFAMNEKVSAVLVNHADPRERDRFARWLQAHPRSREDSEQGGSGNGSHNLSCANVLWPALLLNQPITVREGEVLTIVT